MILDAVITDDEKILQKFVLSPVQHYGQLSRIPNRKFNVYVGDSEVFRSNYYAVMCCAIQIWLDSPSEFSKSDTRIVLCE